MHYSSQIVFIFPLMICHLFWEATILAGLLRGVPLCHMRYNKSKGGIQGQKQEEQGWGLLKLDR